MNGNTILVIDTDTEMIQKIMIALESEGYLVFTASSQDVSITMAKKVNPSLILINIGIEGASGLEICKAIHNTKTLENVPIVVITPHEGRIDSRYTALYGIVDFLKKPFTDEELILKTKNIISVIPAEGAVKEEMDAQPFEDETDRGLLGEEGIAVEPVEEVIKTQPIEEEVSVQPFEEEIDIKLFEEQGIIAEPIEEEIEIQPVKKKIKKDVVKDEIEAHLFEEEIEKGEEELSLTKEKEITDIQGEKVEEIVLDEPVAKMTENEIDEEIAEQAVVEKLQAEEHGEDIKEAISMSQKRDSLYRSRKDKEKGGRKSWIFIPVAALVIMGIIAAGVMVFKGYVLDKKVLSPTVVVPPEPAKQQALEVRPSQEQQKPQQMVDLGKPAPKPISKPEPKPASAAQEKTVVKGIYSVQIGVFKSEENANSLVKKYRGKGYDAFIQKSTAQDKGVLNRVLVGRFDNRKEAAKSARSISSKENINAIIFSQ